MDDDLDVDRRHDRVRDGRRQAERPLGRARRDLRVARRLLPGDRARRPRRRAGGGGALLPRRGRRAAALLRRRRQVDLAEIAARCWTRSATRAAGRAVRAAGGDRAGRDAAGRPRSRGWRRRARSSVLPDGEIAPADDAPPRKAAIEAAAAVGGATGATFDRSRVDMMRAYAETDALPARVRPLVLRRAVRAAVRELRQLPRRARAAPPRRPTSRSRSARASRTASGARAWSSATTTTRSSCCSTRSATGRWRWTWWSSARCCAPPDSPAVAVGVRALRQRPRSGTEQVRSCVPSASRRERERRVRSADVSVISNASSVAGDGRGPATPR